MRFTCDSCGAQYMISDEKVGPNGVKVRCKKCGNIVAVKRAPAVVPEVAPAPPPEPPPEPRAEESSRPRVDEHQPRPAFPRDRCPAGHRYARRSDFHCAQP